MVAQLDLRGFDAELRVMSGRIAQVERLQRLMDRRGADPGNWLNEFMADPAS